MQVLAGVGAAPFAATGGTTQDIGSYRYHVFTGNGTFTPNGNGSVEAFLVAAGGGGGTSGGGGGGGVITFTSVNVLGGTGYSVTVGGESSNSVSGANSTFPYNGGTLTAVGGGKGGASGAAGSSGGSGGGGGSGSSNGGGAGTSGQGNSGGCGVSWGAGGGGYSGAGKPTTCSVGQRGDGGQGYQLSNVADFSSITAFSGMTYVGSGGGGRGDSNLGGSNGSGGTGAGTGQYITAGTDQNATTYGGGGGGSDSPYGKGYQGIVIVRYPLPV